MGETSNLQGKGAPGWDKGLCTVEAHAGYRDSPDSDYGVAERWPLVRSGTMPAGKRISHGHGLPTHRLAGNDESRGMHEVTHFKLSPRQVRAATGFVTAAKKELSR